MRFTNEDKKKILAANDIVELIKSYIDLRPSSGNYISLCPFHKEKTPSFTVSPEYQNYKCFGCNQSGDIINFLMEMENFTFVEALYYLAEKANISINDDQNKITTELSQCLNIINYFYYSVLERCGAETYVSEYLERREISHTLIQRFQLGFTGNSRTHLLKFLLYKKIPSEVQDASGMIRKGKKNTLYELMYNRLIFPIKDRHGRIIGFGGRTLEKNERKYINSPETTLYKKRYALYGIYEAADTIRKKRKVIITEGYFDVIRMHQKGWEETIGICGTALTIEHLRILKQFRIDDIYLLFDGDESGRTAMKKGAVLCLQHNIDCRLIILPKDTDPDDYLLKYTSEDLTLLIEKAVYDFEYILNCIKLNDHLDIQNKQLQYILKLIQSVHNPIKKNRFIEKTALLFQLPRKILIAELYKKTTKVLSPNPNKNLVSDNDKIEDNEMNFFQYLIRYPESINAARQYVSSELFNSKKLKSFYERILQLENDEFSSILTNDLKYIFPEFTDLITSVFEYKSHTVFFNFIKADETFSENRIRYFIRHLIYNKLINKYTLLDEQADKVKSKLLMNTINKQNDLLREI